MIEQKILEKISSTERGDDVYRPVFFRINKSDEKEKLNDLLDENPNIKVSDTLLHQLKELVKSLNPGKRLTQSEIEQEIKLHLNGISVIEYGAWVYYPWKNSLVHILDKNEFISLRTNRNKYKITGWEQDLLGKKTIGIIGLSVGQSIALTIAMERICGHLVLADFDTADLSNLNRLRTGVENIGIRKTIIAAREIMEMDPYMEITLFHEGITEDNVDKFISGRHKLDLLVEVCDGLDVKILARYKARESGIPVVMDTNDRGMIDVERFDLEPGRAILHGLAEGLDPNNIKGLSNEEKVPYILRMVGADTMSTRLKASMLEVEQSISTWPQLASSVALGGGLTTDICRRILLNEFHESGRYYVDFEALVSDKNERDPAKQLPANPFKIIGKEDIEAIINNYLRFTTGSDYCPTEQQINRIIEAAIKAPSAGNNQPWKWAYKNGFLFLFHDRYRSWSWGDYEGMGSYMSLGTAIENVHLECINLRVTDHVTLFPLKEYIELASVIRFSPQETQQDDVTLAIAANLGKRFTNRKLGEAKALPEQFPAHLQAIASTSSDVKIFYTDDTCEIAELGGISAECDKIRLLHDQGHEEFYHEIKWNEDQARADGDGIDLTTVDLTKSEIAGISIASDWKAVQLLSEWDKGDGFKKLTNKAFKTASAVVIFSIPEFCPEGLINAGRTIERTWIYANLNGISVHPFLSTAFFFNRLIHGKGVGFPSHIVNELTILRDRFIKISDPGNYSDVFLMKLSIAEDLGTRSLRKPRNEVFFEFN